MVSYEVVLFFFHQQPAESFLEAPGVKELNWCLPLVHCRGLMVPEVLQAHLGSMAQRLVGFLQLSNGNLFMTN